MKRKCRIHKIFRTKRSPRFLPQREMLSVLGSVWSWKRFTGHLGRRRSAGWWQCRRSTDTHHVGPCTPTRRQTNSSTLDHPGRVSRLPRRRVVLAHLPRPSGTVDQGMPGEGLFTTFREPKPGTPDAVWDGLAPLRWCVFAEPVHGYRGTPVRFEALLANEDQDIAHCSWKSEVVPGHSRILCGSQPPAPGDGAVTQVFPTCRIAGL